MTRRRRIALGLLLALGAAMAWFGLIFVPWPWGLGSGVPGPTALMEQRVDEARAEGRELEIRREWVPLEEIDRDLIRAVLVAEDHRFREHAGVDWQALAEEVKWTGDDDFSWTSSEDRAALREAIAYVRANAATVRGRSTITQQLAKNLWWGTERSFVRKALEVPAAMRLERRLGKDRILELYLNLVEFGPGVFGVEAAAQHYFGRSARSLTLDQAAQLASTLPHPLRSNPATNPGAMQRRKAMLLRRLNPVPGAPELPPMPLPVLDSIPPLEGDGLPVSIPDSVPPSLPADTTDSIPPADGDANPDSIPPAGSAAGPDPAPASPSGAGRDTIG